MANTLYNKARERFLTGQVDWLTDNINAILVTTHASDPGLGYVFNATQQYLSEVLAMLAVGTVSGATVNTTPLNGTCVVAAPELLVSKDATDGAADAANVTWAAVNGPEAEAVILYKDTGDNTTSPLIAYIHLATGLPITPNGGDIIVVWDNGTNKIFRL